MSERWKLYLIESFSVCLVCQFRLSVSSVCFVCPSRLSISSVCLVCLSLLSVCLFCLSVSSVSSVRLFCQGVCLSRLSVSSFCLFCLSIYLKNRVSRLSSSLSLDSKRLSRGALSLEVPGVPWCCPWTELAEGKSSSSDLVFLNINIYCFWTLNIINVVQCISHFYKKKCLLFWPRYRVDQVTWFI